MASAVEFLVADALSLPFVDGSFDGAYSMNVSMNIADKPRLYREIRRVVRPGGWLLLSEVARGEGPEPEYPMPWAATAAASFLATPQQTRDGLVAAGFEVLHVQHTKARALAFGARSREAVARGQKPPHRAVMLVHGDAAAAAMANSARALAEGRVEPIELLVRRL
jgi:SAM-dependent methyltransferase